MSQASGPDQPANIATLLEAVRKAPLDSWSFDFNLGTNRIEGGKLLVSYLLANHDVKPELCFQVERSLFDGQVQSVVLHDAGRDWSDYMDEAVTGGPARDALSHLERRLIERGSLDVTWSDASKLPNFPREA